MKKYETPMINLLIFNLEDVILTSLIYNNGVLELGDNTEIDDIF